MRLSEAIWLGSKLKKQTYKIIWRAVHFKKTKEVEIRTCALGAALDALGCLPTNALMSDAPAFPAAFEPLLCLAVNCPVSSCVMRKQLDAMIAHLNDWHCWSREEIADWVAQVERDHADLATGSDEPVEVAAEQLGVPMQELPVQECKLDGVVAR